MEHFCYFRDIVLLPWGGGGGEEIACRHPSSLARVTPIFELNWTDAFTNASFLERNLSTTINSAANDITGVTEEEIIFRRKCNFIRPRIPLQWFNRSQAPWVVNELLCRRNSSNIKTQFRFSIREYVVTTVVCGSSPFTLLSLFLDSAASLYLCLFYLVLVSCSVYPTNP
jgi:hypothetical protein